MPISLRSDLQLRYLRSLTSFLLLLPPSLSHSYPGAEDYDSQSRYKRPGKRALESPANQLIQFAGEQQKSISVLHGLIESGLTADRIRVQVTDPARSRSSERKIRPNLAAVQRQNVTVIVRLTAATATPPRRRRIRACTVAAADRFAALLASPAYLCDWLRRTLYHADELIVYALAGELPSAAPTQLRPGVAEWEEK